MKLIAKPPSRLCRVSTYGQTLDAQLEQLRGAGTGRLMLAVLGGLAERGARSYSHPHR